MKTAYPSGSTHSRVHSSNASFRSVCRGVRASPPLKALIIDSWFDNYVGVVMLVRVVDGVMRPKDKLFFMSTEATQLCEQVGVFSPKSVQRSELRAGEVGFVISGIKDLKAAKVGDTITMLDAMAAEPLPGFKEI